MHNRKCNGFWTNGHILFISHKCFLIIRIVPILPILQVVQRASRTEQHQWRKLWQCNVSVYLSDLVGTGIQAALNAFENCFKTTFQRPFNTPSKGP